MLKRIAWIVVILLVGFGIWYGYRQFQTTKQATDGAVVCVQNCDTPEEKAAFARVNNGDSADGQSERKDRTAREDASAIAAGFPSGTVAPAPQPVVANQAAPVAQQTYPDPPRAAAEPVIASAPAGLPTTDTRSPNAPNDVRFAGSGAYQWYRQGNLTWRVDTASGRSCIIYATMEEWQKQIVLSHGCGRTA